MKTRYWLHHYSQRRAGGEPLAANCVDKLSPAAFLHHLVKDFPDNDNLLLWSTEISAAEFKMLDGNI